MENHGVEVGRHLWGLPSPNPPVQSRVSWNMLLRAVSGWVSSTLRDEHPTPSQGSLYQCLTTHSKNVLLHLGGVICTISCPVVTEH